MHSLPPRLQQAVCDTLGEAHVRRLVDDKYDIAQIASGMDYCSFIVLAANAAQTTDQLVSRLDAESESEQICTVSTIKLFDVFGTVKYASAVYKVMAVCKSDDVMRAFMYQPDVRSQLVRLIVTWAEIRDIFKVVTSTQLQIELIRDVLRLETLRETLAFPSVYSTIFSENLKTEAAITLLERLGGDFLRTVFARPDQYKYLPLLLAKLESLTARQCLLDLLGGEHLLAICPVSIDDELTLTSENISGVLKIRAGDLSMYIAMFGLEPEVCLQKARQGYHVALAVLQLVCGDRLRCIEYANQKHLIEDKADDLARYQFALAQCYMDGIVVRKDLVFADILLRTAKGFSMSETEACIQLSSCHAAVKRELTQVPHSPYYRHSMNKRTEDTKKYKARVVCLNLLNIGICDGGIIEAFDFAYFGVSAKPASIRYSGYCLTQVEQQLASYCELPAVKADFTMFSRHDLFHLQASIHSSDVYAYSAATPDQLYQRLLAGEVVSIASGWDGRPHGHAIEISFKMIGGSVYMLHTNRGSRGVMEESGTALFRVDNIEKLKDAEYVNSLHWSNAKRDDVFSPSSIEHGIGRDLGLVKLGFYKQSNQKIGNCSNVYAHSRCSNHLLLMSLDKHFQTTGGLPSGPVFSKIATNVMAWYKSFRFFSRRDSIKRLVDIGKPGHGCSIEVDEHKLVLREIITYVRNKVSLPSYKKMQLLQPVLRFLLSSVSEKYPNRMELLDFVRLTLGDSCYDVCVKEIKASKVMVGLMPTHRMVIAGSAAVHRRARKGSTAAEKVMDIYDKCGLQV